MGGDWSINSAQQAQWQRPALSLRAHSKGPFSPPSFSECGLCLQLWEKERGGCARVCREHQADVRIHKRGQPGRRKRS